MSETPKNEWRTPPEVVAWASSIIGQPFDFDAACTIHNAIAYPLWRRSDFKGGDALSAPWPDNSFIWCNPPYGRGKADPFIEKALACKSLVAMLIMSPNGEDRFEQLFPRAHEIHIVGRIGFLGFDGKPVSGNTRGSSLFLINPPFGAGQRSFVLREDIYGRKAA